MKAILTVKSGKGYYDEAKLEGATLKEVIAKIQPAIDSMPDERDGVKLVDWTYMHLEVQRK